MTPSINPQAILIDLDGTLANSLSVMYQAYQKFLWQFNVEPTLTEFDSLNGPPLEEVVRRLKSTHSLRDDAYALHLNYFSLIDDLYTKVRPTAGAEALLLAAKDNHCSVGVVTSNSMKRTKEWLENVGLAHLVNFIISGDDVKNGKPDPEPYQLAAQHVNCPLSQIIAIEDSLQGAKSAVDAGLRTFILTDCIEQQSLWPSGVQQITSLDFLVGLLWQ